MAETKRKAVDAVETPAVQGKSLETKYKTSEIIAACDELFGCPREVAVVALKSSKEKLITVEQARSLIKEFLSKEVK